MFSLQKIEPVFIDDVYDFTAPLISYINGESKTFKAKDKIHAILGRAYDQNSLIDQKNSSARIISYLSNFPFPPIIYTRSKTI